MAGLAGFQSTATREIFGIACLSSPSRLASSSGPRTVMPVTLPPGRARLATRPLRTGSPTEAMTTGMVDVACLAAKAPGVRVVAAGRRAMLRFTAMDDLLRHTFGP